MENETEETKVDSDLENPVPEGVPAPEGQQTPVANSDESDEEDSDEDDE